MKKGFVSTAVVYTFLIIFLLVISSLLTTYLNRYNHIIRIIEETKSMLNEGYDE